jgi:nicotinate phosphoribosyltransferase
LRDPDGRAAGDLLALADEPPPDAGEPLLETVVRGGELVRPHPALSRIRERCAAQLGALPEGLRRLNGHDTYPVRPSEALRARQAKAVAGARAR